MELALFQKTNLKHQADLGFINDEIIFLQGFLETNYPAAFTEITTSRVQLLYDRLIEFKLAQQYTMEDAVLHANHLLLKSIAFLTIESERIGDKTLSLTKNFKSLKTEILDYYKASTLQISTVASEELQLN